MLLSSIVAIVCLLCIIAALLLLFLFFVLCLLGSESFSDFLQKIIPNHQNSNRHYVDSSHFPRGCTVS